MECKHEPARRGESWGGTSIHKTSLEIMEDDGRVKPGLTSCQMERKTNLSRSASLSEKELKEARTKSQIIAAQLQANSNSKGVQLFNRRRQRVNAFTLVSVGGAEVSENVIDSSSASPRTWDKQHSPEDRKNQVNNRTALTRIHSTGHNMEDASKVTSEDVPEESSRQTYGRTYGSTQWTEVPSEVTREDLPEDSSQERHFLPVNERDDELSEEDVKDEVIHKSDNTSVMNRTAQDEVHNKEIQNGYSTQFNGNPAKAVPKQASIMNRTARPFFSPTTVGSSEAPVMESLPAASYVSTNPQPSIPMHSRPVFSPPPPPPSYPTPPLPSPAEVADSQSSSYYIRPSVPRPTFIPELLSEKRSVTPIRTGILDEGRLRRTTRKSMFTFQEKPKVAPNPELLSMVQVADEKKKPKAQAEEEELLALGAEASNFLSKDEDVHEEAVVPQWASSLRSSRTRARMEHKPEQALTNASGKGAELFAKRQSRMERYVHDSKDLRSPSPTMSLPPSWVYPSNMPGRVKAIVNTSNISAQISKTLQAQQATQKKITPVKSPAPAPAPAPEVPLENGCTKIEMELSKHQPYQLNSSLFIFSPTKDPYSTLPRSPAAPNPVIHSYSRQTSLPSSPLPFSPSSSSYRSAHCFSPPMTSLSSPERVASPRSGVQAPRPTFSAKKAGIAPQIKEISSPGSAIRTPTLSRSFTVPEVISSSSSPIYKPSPISPRPIHKPISTCLSTSPIHKPIASTPTSAIFKPAGSPASPISPPWETRCQSPAVNQDTKTNHRILAKNIINAAKRKNSPSPGAVSGRVLPVSPFEHKPVFTSPTRMLTSPTRMSPSPVRLYSTRSLTDSDASLESEDSGLRSRSYNSCPRGWSAALQVKRGGTSEEL